MADGQKYIPWPEDCSQELVDDCKVVLYVWFKRGLPGSKPPVAMGICQTAIASAIPMMRWLTALNIKRFDQVRPIHVANYVHHTKARLTRNAHSVYDSLRILDFLWCFATRLRLRLLHVHGARAHCGGSADWQTTRKPIWAN